MEWLLILALGIWVYRQGQRIQALERRLSAADELERLTRLRAEAPSPAPPPAEVPTPPVEPLVLKPAPIPEPVLAARAPEPERVFTPPPPPPRPEPRVLPRPAPPPRLAPTITRESISTWLSENGLAWIGGGGLALGGLLLVAYAAQRGLFIPEFRITMAVLLGAAMVGASEWILRQKPSIAGGRHLLAAAVSAGAGAVTLYGAVCSAHGLYHLIPLSVAAVLAAAISLGLLALSLRHGEPLALVAVIGAVLTPAFTGLPDWSPLALTAYLVLIGATGFSIAAARLWGKAGGATAVGLLLLSGVPLADRQTVSVMIIQLLAAVGPFAAVLWRRQFRRDDTADPAGRDFRSLPATALVLTSLSSFGVWFAAPITSGHLPIAALLAGLLVVLAAMMATRDIVRPRLFAVPVGMALFCQLLVMIMAASSPAFPAQLPWLYALTALIPATALWTALRLPAVERTQVLTIGGVGVAVLASLAWPILRDAHVAFGWAPAAILAAALFAASPLIARRVEQPSTDRGLALWLAAAAEMTFLAVHAAVLPRFEPAAFALAALVLAGAAWRLPWRGLAPASVVGGLIAFVAMLRPEFIGEALDGRLPLVGLLAISAVAALVLVLSAQLIWKGGGEIVRNEAEALRASALLIALMAVFTALHMVLSGPRVQGADGLLEASLRTLALLSTGLLLVLRQRPDDGPITRWRTVAVVTLGVVHGLLLQGLAWNPWWGAGEAPAGPPVLNTLILSYLAPAGLLAAIGWRRRPGDDRWTQGWVAAVPMFAFLWALLGLRHLFHPAAMDHAPVGRLELAALALLPMLTARALVEPRLGMASPQAARLRAAVPSIGWIALAVLLVVFGVAVSPWWGAFIEPLSLSGGALLFGLQAAAIALAWAVSRREATIGRAALVTAVVLALSLVMHLIRWSFHGPAISVGGIGRAEGAAYAILTLVAARLLTSPRLAGRTNTGWLVSVAPAIAWLALVAAGLVFGFRASPWWGPILQPLESFGAAALLFGLYAVGAVAMLQLRRGDTPFDRAALAAAVGTLFALLTLLIRYAFHGGDMHAVTHGGGLETWTFSALWAVFGLAVLSLGAGRKDFVLRWAGLAALLFTAAKVVFFDLARLEGVTRAASFLAVGALFLGGALLARRLNARHATSAEEANADAPP
jgi:uncharacterized membrane protein